jgi:hypothetical protein
MARIRGFLDKYTERFVSRKFLAWLTATGLIVAQKIDGEAWVAITLGYIGAQSVIEAAMAWKHGSNK